MLHVKIRQGRDGANREHVVISGEVPEVWHGIPAPMSLDDNLEKTMKSSIITYMTESFGVRSNQVIWKLNFMFRGKTTGQKTSRQLGTISRLETLFSSGDSWLMS